MIDTKNSKENNQNFGLQEELISQFHISCSEINKLLKNLSNKYEILLENINNLPQKLTFEMYFSEIKNMQEMLLIITSKKQIIEKVEGVLEEIESEKMKTIYQNVYKSTLEGLYSEKYKERYFVISGNISNCFYAFSSQFDDMYEITSLLRSIQKKIEQKDIDNLNMYEIENTKNRIKAYLRQLEEFEKEMDRILNLELERLNYKSKMLNIEKLYYQTKGEYIKISNKVDKVVWRAYNGDIRDYKGSMQYNYLPQMFTVYTKIKLLYEQAKKENLMIEYINQLEFMEKGIRERIIMTPRRIFQVEQFIYAIQCENFMDEIKKDIMYVIEKIMKVYQRHINISTQEYKEYYKSKGFLARLIKEESFFQPECNQVYLTKMIVELKKIFEEINNQALSFKQYTEFYEFLKLLNDYHIIQDSYKEIMKEINEIINMINKNGQKENNKEIEEKIESLLQKYKVTFSYKDNEIHRVRNYKEHNKEDMVELYNATNDYSQIYELLCIQNMSSWIKENNTNFSDESSYFTNLEKIAELQQFLDDLSLEEKAEKRRR